MLFIGRALVRRLLARGDRVTIILHRARTNRFTGQVDELHCDPNDGDAVRQALEGQRFDFVYDNVYDLAARHHGRAGYRGRGSLRRRPEALRLHVKQA
jgi:nucleoside-diphosphate-sugar epimerase